MHDTVTFMTSVERWADYPLSPCSGFALNAGVFPQSLAVLAHGEAPYHRTFELMRS